MSTTCSATVRSTSSFATASVTEIMVDWTEQIYVERFGLLERTNARFTSEDHLMRVIDRIVSSVGRRIDEASPMVDARLPDGSRVNAIIPPLSLQGPVLTVRKFSAEALSAADLVLLGTLTAELVDVLHASVAGKLNVLISGGTGVGKTTLLNIMSGFIPDGERIISIEDAAELRPAAAARRLARIEAVEHRGPGRGTHPRSRAQRTSHAP